MLKKILLFFLIISVNSNSFAQGISIIRDAQTENFLNELTKPILKAANLDPENIKIYIVNDSSINAFVSGGQNIFINTGLITKYDNPDTLMGVIAHEAGHIASGHLARGSEEMKTINKAVILTYLAGIAAAVSSNPDAGFAMIMGGNHIAQRLALKYNRSQEEAADRLAIKYLDKINYSASGLMTLLEFFDRQEASFRDLIDEYALTHPVSRKRINYLKAHLNDNIHNNQIINNKLQPEMDVINVKLKAFLEEPNHILNRYSNNSFLDKYARSIAYFKKGKIEDSLSLMDSLLKERPNDGYLWELKGQILFESGSTKESIIAYKKALTLQKQNPNLIKIALANAIISLNSNDKELTDFAIKNLESTLPQEKNDPNVFRKLAAAYNQNNKKGRAYLALAEVNLLKKDAEKTKKYAELAKKNLPKDDKSSLIKADDILAVAKELKKP